MGKCATCAEISANQTCYNNASCGGMPSCPTSGCLPTGARTNGPINTHITDVNLIADGTFLWKAKYSIRSEKQSNLISVVSEWTVKSNEDGETLKLHRVVDSWVQGRRVAGPDLEGSDGLQIKFQGRKGFAVSRVEILYAEYADGSVEGSAKDCFEKSLKAQRSRISNAHRKIVTMIENDKASITDVLNEMNSNPDYAYLQLAGLGSVEKILSEAKKISNRRY